MTDPLRTPERIAFAGDWHMNRDWAADAIGYAREQGADVVIQLGDFGYTFDARFMKTCENAARLAGISLLFVDGNHECFPTLLRYPIRENGLRQLTSRVWHLPRGARWTWGELRFLALGGAHSVDRRWRTPGADWWREETISAPEAMRAVAGGPADVMVTHDCPAGVDLGLPEPGRSPFPEVEIRAANQHRALLRSVVDEVQPRFLWHGHYHEHAHRSTVDLGYGPVEVTGLDCDGSRMERNVQLVDLAELHSVVHHR
ncbi:metallophosphoesterase [Micromonospora sp. NPDC047730]|uniref:metallophosphoesterase family protein n=1 Tax=Micromonospora sp. NPDC047730 TaxID=3364253 RepID=UPI00371DCC1E